jgi:hypothetical protein
VKRNAGSGRVVVTADGRGVVSHAGCELLRELTVSSKLVAAWNTVMADTYAGAPVHEPGRVLADLAVAMADGAKSISDLARLRDTGSLFGPVASTSTAWRVLDRVDRDHLYRLRAGRAVARAAAWAAGAGPDLEQELCLDIDATIVIAHSDKDSAAPTWKRTYGFHPLLCFLDRPDVASGEALAGILRPGNAGSNTAADHIEVLDLALASLPLAARPGRDGARVLMRSDSAGATHAFAAACRARGVGFSFGFPITEPLREAISLLPAPVWECAVDTDGGIRDGARVAEITGLVADVLAAWPEGCRIVVRRERPHPGAALSLFDTVEGHRHTAFITDTPPRVVPGQLGGLELRHRQHARVEDRIRDGKAAGLRNLPCKGDDENAAWLEVVLAGLDLVCWSKLICFPGDDDDDGIAFCEIDTFRYRILHMAARLTRSSRRLYLRLDATWRWATALARGFRRLRTAFG